MVISPVQLPQLMDPRGFQCFTAAISRNGTVISRVIEFRVALMLVTPEDASNYFSFV